MGRDRLAMPAGGLPGGISFHHQSADPSSSNGQHPADYWEETMFIPTTFNRMVLIRSGTAFRPAYRFGTTAQLAGLVQVILAEAGSPL